MLSLCGENCKNPLCHCNTGFWFQVSTVGLFKKYIMLLSLLTVSFTVFFFHYLGSHEDWSYLHLSHNMNRLLMCSSYIYIHCRDIYFFWNTYLTLWHIINFLHVYFPRCREGYQGIRCDQFLPKTDSVLSDPSKSIFSPPYPRKHMAHRLRKWRCYILSFRVNVSFCKKTFKKCSRRYCSCWPWFYDFLLQSLSSAA